MEGLQGRNHGERLLTGSIPGLLSTSFHPCIAQAHLPKHGAIQSGIGSPRSIINQDNFSQRWSHANIIEI